ncbi:DUF2637 domain-containing protein [Actinoplanes sp. HUAS TT8]|uniref:DUF2637 domain-containing protein n=1 Tax=Actinoplanes sp. HUAS TT8 TaxID=3447453 RepID=UPI003F521BF9
MTQEEKHVRQTLNWLIRPALVAAIALTVYGNLAQAQPSVGGWVSHGWAPALYLVLVEILVRRAVGGGWFWPVLVGFVALALVAGVVSFTSLTHAAVRWGWEPSEAWLFPIIVDLTAVLLTMASMGTGARLRELAATEPAPNARTASRTPEPAPERAEPAPEQAESAERPAAEPSSDPNSKAERIIAEFGTDPNAWPRVKEMAEQFGCAPSTASAHRKKALALVSQAAQVEAVGAA